MDKTIPPQKHVGLRITRRTLLQAGAAAGVLGTLFYFGQRSGSKLKPVHQSLPMMGTIVNMTVVGPDEQRSREAIGACIARMESLSGMLSTYIPTSPISRLNRDGILRGSPPELVELFLMSRELSELTRGAFDPTIMVLLGHFKEVRKTGQLPAESEIKEILQLVDYRHIVVEDQDTIRYSVPGTKATLDGIAKGYIVDQGVVVLQDMGVTEAFVEAGGDLMTLGRRQDGKPWRIGIRNPRSDDLKKMDTIELSDRAIATSGDYMQYFTDDRKVHHIINPRTGFSPIVLASSSIQAPTVARADGLATATMVLGPEESVRLVDSLPECEGHFIDKDLNKYQTKGFFS
jgi:thiamine biosynthesis lipoprotein